MELIKHECGIAMLRLRKPLKYYEQKYGSRMYGLRKLYLMMEKQHNRGQEAAGVGCIKQDATPGNEYIFRERAQGNNAIAEIFASINRQILQARQDGLCESQAPFIGECYMGHLRYSTTGRSGISYVHPFMRRNNWRARNMLLCGNFNLTNVNELFKDIVATGQHPRLQADTFILLEQLGHALDRESERLFNIFHHQGLKGMELADAIADNMDMANVLERCSPTWDGGFVICGIAGNGDMFAMRDSRGIRPAFYYIDDEVIAVASERPVIQTALNVHQDDVQELNPGQALIIGHNADYRLQQILQCQDNCRCSFERIYFSRGSDADIYKERKALGSYLLHPVLKAVGNDIDNTVFSFIPNTAEVSYIGMMDAFRQYLSEKQTEDLNMLLADGTLTSADIERIMRHRIRTEKVAVKDIKLRTFIAEDSDRNDLAAHVYDITYGTIRSGKDNLVVIDDSIVRGTTLRESIISILDRLNPKKIVIVSSAPQVRYPDCYGIDMSRLGEFIAFRAAIQLLKDTGRQQLIADVYHKCVSQRNRPKEEIVNYVKEIYAPFTVSEISAKIVELLKPAGTRADVEIIYQTLDGLHKAIPSCPGDWYFSGNYPTPGGYLLLNETFISFYEGNPDTRP